MTIEAGRRLKPPPATWAELFTPKLVTVLREGYGLQQFRADVIAGLTVAIVALPLSMAIAIASGATPAQGLYTAIIGGFFISALGGSRFQIGGPAGAFIVLVAATVQAHGLDGLILATALSGIILLLLGALRLGTFIKYIPFPVTVGFTAGIAAIIFASQIRNLLGLTLPAAEPAPFLEKLPVLAESLHTANPPAIAVSLATIVIIAGLRKLRPNWPGMLIAVAAAAIVTWAMGLSVATIGSEFGGIPSSLPAPRLPDFTLEKIQAVLPSAFAFALLGSIEALLSAVVADGMTGRRHRSNCELVAQGFANIASSLFGGICATGTIARTATNVRAGAHGPIAGIIHSAAILLFILVAAPLASYIPLASLAGVLAIVAWSMVEKSAIAALWRSSRGEAAVLAITFLLTVFRDLTEAIVVGFALGSVLFIHRISNATAIEAHPALVPEDQADGPAASRQPYDHALVKSGDAVVYRISGAFFFGAAAALETVLDRISEQNRVLILDFTNVPFVDSSAAHTIEGVARKTGRRGARLILTGTSHDMRRELFAHGLKPPLVTYDVTVEKALASL